MAVRLARDGFRVAAVDLNLDEANETASIVTQSGGKAMGFQFDVSSTSAINSKLLEIEGCFIILLERKSSFSLNSFQCISVASVILMSEHHVTSREIGGGT